MDEEVKKYAKMLISMSTEYLLGKYDEDLYVDIVKIASDHLTRIKKNTDNGGS